ncbi:MAG TPA: DUF4214 domain-containing protein, partial [Pyrinomonadaceae bacterium]
TSGNTIAGNFIGTDVSGTVAVGNGSEGVALFDGTNNTVGGTSAGARNIISGNNNNGVLIFGESTSSVLGNFIGTAVNGTSPLANLGDGVRVAGSNDAIGGVTTGAGNIIAFNSFSGVGVNQDGEIPTGVNASIRGNSIYSNGALGIDLRDDGVTLNDPCDGDTGANFFQNYPVLSQAINDLSQHTIITGSLNSVAGMSFTLDFYASPNSDPSGYGEGRTYVGSGNVTTSQDCLGQFNFSFPAVEVGQFISATATDSAGNTSEFSLNVQVTTPTAASATISGRVTRSDGSPVAGVTINLIGLISAQAITDTNGHYEIGDLNPGGFYTVTPLFANHTFSPANRTFSLIGNRVEATFTATSSLAISANPLDTNLFFVRQQYLDFLGREPDASGLSYWSNQIDQCGSNPTCTSRRRTDVAASFFIEREFQQTGFFIYRLYLAALGRRLSFAEFSHDRLAVNNGGNSGGSELFTAGFVQRPEFVEKYLDKTTPQSFVDAVVTTVQQVSGVDLTGQKAALIARYNSGTNLTNSRSLVLRDVAEDPNVRQSAYNPAFVLMEYFGYLQRDPDEGGYRFWLTVLNDRESQNYHGMVCAFITSAEYQRRFSLVVSRTNAECLR